MPARSRDTANLAVASVLLTTVCAIPSVNFPVNSQVPSVARVSQPFSFTFAESTFTDSQGAMSYTLQDQPPWLQFDSGSRTFHGEPTTDDSGTTTFGLIATDSSGSTSSDVTLIVKSQSGPQIGRALLSQLREVGRTSAPSSLFLYPLQAFSITFSPDTFSNTTKDTIYYATSADNSPLPSWLQFDAISTAFSGIAPPLVSPTAKPQEYGVRLIASEVVGFAEAVATFQIVIGYQILAFSEASQTIKVSEGEEFETSPLRADLKLDGKSVEDSQLASVSSNAPDWLKFNTERILLKGTPPQGATSQSVLIKVSDLDGDTANTTVTLIVARSDRKLFNSSLAPVNATIGLDFHYTIDASTLSSGEIQIGADVSNASTWLTYDATSRTFSGSVPNDLQPGTLLITLTATLKSTLEREQLTIQLLKPLASTSSVSHPSRAVITAPNSSDSATTPIAQNMKDSKRRLAIVLGVVLPLLLLTCIGALVFCLRWRRRRRQERLRNGQEKQISRPLIQPDNEPNQGHDGENATEPEKAHTPTSPPRIELPWAPDSLRRSRERMSKVVMNRESTLVGSGWGELVTRDPSVPESNSRKLAARSQDVSERPEEVTLPNAASKNNLNYSRKRPPLRPSQAKIRKPSLSSRASKTLSGLSTLSVGLPVRLSGAGHGAGGPSPPPPVVLDVRRSWRNTLDSSASEDGRGTPFDLDAFPQPPSAQEEKKQEQSELAAKPGVRLVPSSSSHSGSFVSQRQKWVRDRARDRQERGSRFSHAWSSRADSRARGLSSSIRSSSIAKSGSIDRDDLPSRRNTQRSWSHSSSVGAPVRPDTWSRIRSPDSHLVRNPSNLRRALSTVSSGRYDSADSKSNSSWIDDLIEEEDEDGHRRWITVERPSQENLPIPSPALPEAGESEQGSWGRNSRTRGLGALRANIQGVGIAAPTGERKWRLGGEQAKRPISVDEGELQRSQGSQRGNLAFI
jgi:axial budding pattern protein 2